MGHRISVRTVGVAALIIGLVGLNVFQYFSKSGLPRFGALWRSVRDSGGRSRLPPGAPVDLKVDQEVVDRFHQLSYDQQFRFMRVGGDFRDEDEDYTASRWLGVIALQNPNDVWIHQEIITELKPDFIVETGTLLGGGALIWATVLAQVNPEGRVITIDIRDQVEKAKDHPLWKKMVRQVVAGSTDPAVVADVKRQVTGKSVMFILDSDHSMKHVLAELEAYAPMTPVGGYVIVQDGDVNGHPILPDFGPGPYEAIEAFLAKDDRFVSDRSRERFMFTMHPKGYLKRVK